MPVILRFPDSKWQRRIFCIFIAASLGWYHDQSEFGGVVARFGLYLRKGGGLDGGFHAYLPTQQAGCILPDNIIPTSNSATIIMWMR